MVSVGVVDEPVNQAYDVISTGALILNLAASILLTFDNITAVYGGLLLTIEQVTVLFFGIDYVLRLITANYLYPESNERDSLIRYIFSAAGIIDLLSFLPYYLPWFFPSGLAVFRMFRVARIFRLFRINAYYDSLNVITEVIVSKKQQLLSSVFIILTLMLASSLCMYSLEHEAQPEVFQNAFSGFWWAVSTLLTVGYGDIYPVTIPGRLFGILITFLGVGMVAIPTGILSAGFVEQYTKLKSLNDYALATDIRFVRLPVREGHPWRNLPVKDLPLPPGLILAIIQRKNEVIVPRGDTVVEAGDQLVLGAEAFQDEAGITLKELTLTDRHPWAGLQIKDLDISRQTVIVMVRRNGRVVIPNGSLQLLPGDNILLYTKRIMRNTQSVQI